MNFKILHYATLDSTNNYARELANMGAKEGTVVLADYQTKGRGRFKRRWVSQRGKDLLFTVIVRPKNLKASAASMITQLTAMSIRDVLKKECGIQSRIKRPNDLLVEDKKICGTLVEGSTQSSSVEYLIVGIGLNVNSQKKELVRGATSIYEVSRKKQDKEHLLQLILENFGVYFNKFK